MSTCRPAATSRHPRSWTCVGSAKAARNQSRVAGAKRTRKTATLSSLIAFGSTNKRSLSWWEIALQDPGVKLNAIDKYPFERFSDDAKQALVAAQKEAEISQRGYIGTEHLLVGLLRIGSGSAYRALLKLAIDAETVRTMIEKALRGAERSGLPQPIPTTRVKRVVEIAFEESRRMGWQTVESGHVLMGLRSKERGSPRWCSKTWEPR